MALLHNKNIQAFLMTLGNSLRNLTKLYTRLLRVLLVLHEYTGITRLHVNFTLIRTRVV